MYVHKLQEAEEEWGEEIEFKYKDVPIPSGRKVWGYEVSIPK